MCSDDSDLAFGDLQGRQIVARAAQRKGLARGLGRGLRCLPASAHGRRLIGKHDLGFVDLDAMKRLQPRDLVERKVREQAQEPADIGVMRRSDEHTSELQSLMRISYAVILLKKK